MADEKQVKARVLAAINHDGEPHKVDAVISAPASVIKEFASQGVVDPHPDAVAYAEGLAAKAKAAADAK